ncbi:hypothetical protein LOC68_01275 [Blastopirellula sp. JC732]|uniref:Tetratricopeptide repeat protein n=1 Tax=Blastopirellula sediminis TaxID=2894196 RepID=A0A9X1SEX2_9BACT|nr:hypothetical protein [Blastopirellula sediminis]MCC9608181.1 hypothetical protein [Blastopirellula sediminis]MCC9627026.1 hypothetical protein [Blastopirellula sediminis]
MMFHRSSRFRILIPAVLLLTFLALACETLADEDAAKTPLKKTQLILLEHYTLAYDRNDYQQQRNVMQQIYDVTVNNKSDLRLLTAAEARMILDDHEAALAMPVESLQKARQMQVECRLGNAATLQKDYPRAIVHLDKALELSEVYGADSYEQLRIKVQIAAASEYTGGDINRGIAIATDVRTELERRNMADCHLYSDTLAYLYILQLAAGKEPEGIETGETLIQLLQKQQEERTLRFVQVTGMIARFLNIAKRHDEAYRYAALGLKTCPELVGEDMKYGLLLLQECAKALANLNDYEQVPVLYEKILSTIAATPGYPDHLKLEFLKEYAAILETMGEQQRNVEIKREIEKIKYPPMPPKSLYSDWSMK